MGVFALTGSWGTYLPPSCPKLAFRIPCKPFKRNGGDDGARTRGLCRDSWQVISTFNDIGEHGRPASHWKYIIDNVIVYCDVYREGFCQPVNLSTLSTRAARRVISVPRGPTSIREYWDPPVFRSLVERHDIELGFHFWIRSLSRTPKPLHEKLIARARSHASRER